jgi:polysaccharide biosynthesis/export protein
LIKKNILLISILIIFSSNINAQIYPTYSERSAFNSKDSVEVIKNSMSASEGVIDDNEYIVGPGDNFFISVSGIDEKIMNLLINHEGYLYIPRVGVVDLRNKSLKESKDLIYSLLNKNFKNVDIYVGLGEIRKIKVSLVGDVATQSSLVLTSNSRLNDLFRTTSGFYPHSDMRNIKIKSKNGDLKIYDFLTFLRKGDYKQNPYLKDGDVVIVEKVDKIISILGHVLYPASYEFRQGETVSDLIELAGGLSYKARKDSIELIRFDKAGLSQYSEYYSFEYLQKNPIELKYSDMVYVRELTTYYDEQWVTLEGEIKFPGTYKIVKNKTTLTQIINEAGGFSPDASLIDATVYRDLQDTTYDAEFERLKFIPRVDMTDDEYDYFKAKSRQRMGKVVVNFNDLFSLNNLSNDIILKKSDIINVPEKKNYITIMGQVVNPGSIIYDKSLSIKDYIQLAGGFSWRAVESDVRVIKSNTGEWVEEDDIISLDPGDTIWVLEDPPGPKFWDVFTTSLTIIGQLAAIIAASVAVIIATR